MDSKKLKISRLADLYHILNSNTTTFCGYNNDHIVFWFFRSFLFAVSIMFPIGLQYLRNVIIEYMYYIGCISNFILYCYKIYNVLYYSKDIWKLINVTKLYLSSNKHYNSNVPKNRQTQSVQIIHLNTTVKLFASFTWFFSQCVLNKSKIAMRNNIGRSYSKYQRNINLNVIASREMYNICIFIYFMSSK